MAGGGLPTTSGLRAPPERWARARAQRERESSQRAADAHQDASDELRLSGAQMPGGRGCSVEEPPVSFFPLPRGFIPPDPSARSPRDDRPRGDGGRRPWRPLEGQARGGVESPGTGEALPSSANRCLGQAPPGPRTDDEVAAGRTPRRHCSQCPLPSRQETAFGLSLPAFSHSVQSLSGAPSS
jgi:hypothetical protein